MTFLHLNCHSDRTLMRGLVKPDWLARWCSEQGLPAACLTDMGTMSGLPGLYRACKEHGVMPIYGMEVFVVPDRTQKTRKAEQAILLAKDEEGFKNLTALATMASMFFYYFPRLDLDAIARYSKGLICLTGCMQGIASYAFFRDGLDGLAKLHEQWGEVFGDDLYFEIEPVPADSHRVLNEGIVEFCYESGANMVATGDCHYGVAGDRDYHAALLESKQREAYDWEYPFKGDYHVRTADEMRQQFISLHGADCFDDPVTGPLFEAAMDAPLRIAAMVEPFDIRHGVKVPPYQP